MSPMLTRMNNLMVLLVSWLGMMLVYNGDTIDMKRTVQYKQIQNLPSDECKIGDISAIPALPICLIRCSEEADCLTVVYEGNTCSWYKSCELVHDKGPEQEIMTKTEVETITHLEVCEKMMPCEHGEACISTIFYPFFTCRCKLWCQGSRCEECYSIPGLFASKTAMTLSTGKAVEALFEDGWILLMRRQDGSVDFADKLWNDYKDGFGQLGEEFWLGNEKIHDLTTNASYRVRFDFVTFDGRWTYAEYSTFMIGPETDNYRLKIGGYSGTACNDIYLIYWIFIDNI
ncbi:hypothetical protein LSH36_212g04000 [Paralvinella palmiformis]|uniref:Uncharacterized protein n=1 Tax=Paralvinella palmiformis TaxID=53620 RepID=A0AAD9N465_9ANNE|nr:hypothetical protein LSH36_212g04000 [Paralvinella palmiformis]